ncbi:MAG: permease [Alphaproteobacteria bacterium]|jgi:uncharacterized protein|nr:permease [Alphaproteobacteria bacterium]MBT4016551.1 permease [Alphaproteobacteria bacterium]MBT4967164.1 permease [Alphaproteobacteria bacterium]MBT5158531.1 permease [Alphaproteobacteria bacterium]MBT5919728.1 permease [Alphaproteobacteria bacterium]
MSDTSISPASPLAWLKKADKVILTIIGVFAGLLIFLPDQALDSAIFTGQSLGGIIIFLIVAVSLAAWATATGLDKQIAHVFSGNPTKTIILAALFGALSPFCSCGVVPIIAGLLAAGVPLAPVMAFWIASPIMDPSMFFVTSAVLGIPFAAAKTIAAVVMGLGAGFAMHVFAKSAVFANPLRPMVTMGCGTNTAPLAERTDPEIVWKFWQHEERRAKFVGSTKETGWFLLRWLTLAFLLESLMVAYLPADFVGSWLGGDNWWSIPLGVFVGIPTYLNGYAAVPTIDALLNLGMMPGAAMSFLIAGSVTSIPAAMAVFALVRLPIFGFYILLGVVGATLSGIAWQVTMF